MADFLEGMRIASLRRVRSAARRESEAALRRRASDAAPAPDLVLSRSGFDVIAEVKRRAPGPTGAGAVAGESADVSADADVDLPARLAAAYAAGGAAAVSVLTEPLAFDGSLDDLRRASRTLAPAPRSVPTMRKDFLTAPYQVFEARAAGAGGVLLIADMLERPHLGELVDAAAEAGLWALVEAFTPEGSRRAAAAADRAAGLGIQALVGVNVRDLRTLAVDPDRLSRLAPRLTPRHPAVAESGIRTPADAARAARLGYRAALVGRALAGSRDPGGLLAAMIRAGRDARAVEPVAGAAEPVA